MGKDYGKIVSTNFPGSPHTMNFVAFYCAIGNWWRYPCISHVMKNTIDGNLMEKKHPYYGKVWVTISQVFPLQWVLLRFPALWEIDREIYAFFIQWSIGQDENLMEKSTRTMEKRMWINFLGFPHSMGFATISHAIGNWWGNSCISHLMEYTKRWKSNGKKAPVLGVLQNVVHFGKKKFPNFERKMFILSLRSFSPSNSR